MFLISIPQHALVCILLHVIYIIHFLVWGHTASHVLTAHPKRSMFPHIYNTVFLISV